MQAPPSQALAVVAGSDEHVVELRIEADPCRSTQDICNEFCARHGISGAEKIKIEAIVERLQDHARFHVPQQTLNLVLGSHPYSITTNLGDDPGHLALDFGQRFALGSAAVQSIRVALEAKFPVLRANLCSGGTRRVVVEAEGTS
mmetsp:Transcript_31815/g.92428  ORF Transcript_31815/g.92428 Transcript_31815/m.92428 type:complete len:145 (-) Transcript_31815:102-536(-)